MNNNINKVRVILSGISVILSALTLITILNKIAEDEDDEGDYDTSAYNDAPTDEPRKSILKRRIYIEVPKRRW